MTWQLFSIGLMLGAITAGHWLLIEKLFRDFAKVPPSAARSAIAFFVLAFLTFSYMAVAIAFAQHYDIETTFCALCLTLFYLPMYELIGSSAEYLKKQHQKLQSSYSRLGNLTAQLNRQKKRP